MLSDFFRKGSPRLRDAHDALAFAVHAAMLKDNFDCVGVGHEDDTNDAEKKVVLGLSPPGWNNLDEVYEFRYRHSRLPGDVTLLKILRFDRSLIVHTMRQKDNQLHTTELNVDDYIVPSVGLLDSSQFLKNESGLLNVLCQGAVGQVTPPEEKLKPKTTEREEHRHANPLVDPNFVMRPRPIPVGGDFDQDLNPFFPGGLGGGPGYPGPGNLFGPERFRIPGQGDLGGPRGMHPRYDPTGPFGPLGQEPNPDHLRMPRGFDSGPGFGPNLGRGRGRGGPRGGDPFM